MKKKVTAFLHNLFHPHDYFRVLGVDRYTSLKIRIILLDAIFSLVPLFIVITISYFWFQQILKDDFRNQFKWEIGNTKQSIESFVDERLSGLRFLSSAYTYEQLSDQKILADTFSKFKMEFSGLVDIGVIDSNGIQRSYIGPYHLEVFQVFPLNIKKLRALSYIYVLQILQPIGGAFFFPEIIMNKIYSATSRKLSSTDLSLSLLDQF